ncbi:hypothetical protein C8Q77DRAFT_1130283 [Trametes polyzona]|nr:hypothetical protein C8Q77DRAFT_1130283 [Trametes polyzona]
MVPSNLSPPAQPPSLTASPSVQSPSFASSPHSFPSASHPYPSPSHTETEPTASRGSSEPGPSKKPRIQLAPDQPPTTHGKPRERVYLACSQCRSRKVRCDGGKPECFNCSKRYDSATDPCSYDSAPRRRGKDRTPGSRKLAPYIPKKTRTTRSRLEEEAKRNKASGSAPPPSIPPTAPAAGPARSAASTAPTRNVPLAPAPTSPQRPRPAPRERPSRSTRDSSTFDVVPSFLTQLAQADPTPEPFLFQPSDALSFPVQHSVLSEGEQNQDDDDIIYLATEPSVQFTRETWWDALLALYAAPPDRPDLAPPLTVDVRDRTSERIAADLRFLFHSSLHWLSFINIPRFFSSLFNPVTRQAIQPSLILAALGLATFLQSSELELGARGREKALRLIDQAHATFDASFTAGWIDVGLVQAAWMLAFFEIQAHPKLTPARTREGMSMLDALIRCLSLTTLDVDDPRATVFVPRTVPTVLSDAPTIAPAAPLLHLLAPSGTHPPRPPPGALNVRPPVSPATPLLAIGGPPAGDKWLCGCEAYSLGHRWPPVRDLAPEWAEMPMWPKDVSAGEMLREECRRLVWSSVMLTATRSTKSTAGTDWETHHLWMKDPSNYALLFPGENVAEHDGTTASSKDSVWALYMRTLLLWHSSLRMRSDYHMTDADRAQYAMNAWLEIDNIEALLDRHTCVAERGFLVQVRDILFNTRMVVSHEFQRYIPEAMTAPGRLFYHDKASQWMHKQLYVAKFFSQALQNPKAGATNYTRRNVVMFWFMSQISRALKLWEADHSLTIALEVARVLAPATESLMLLWPSPGQRREYELLRTQLVMTCMEAGIPPPERALGYTGPSSTFI